MGSSGGGLGEESQPTVGEGGREESLNCWPDVHDSEKWTRVQKTNGVKEKKKGDGKRGSDRLPDSQLVKEGRRRREGRKNLSVFFFFLSNFW